MVREGGREESGKKRGRREAGRAGRRKRIEGRQPEVEKGDRKSRQKGANDGRREESRKN